MIPRVFLYDLVRPNQVDPAFTLQVHLQPRALERQAQPRPATPAVNRKQRLVPAIAVRSEPQGHRALFELEHSVVFYHDVLTLRPVEVGSRLRPVRRSPQRRTRIVQIRPRTYEQSVLLGARGVRNHPAIRLVQTPVGNRKKHLRNPAHLHHVVPGGAENIQHSVIKPEPHHRNGDHALGFGPVTIGHTHGDDVRPGVFIGVRAGKAPGSVCFVDRRLAGYPISPVDNHGVGVQHTRVGK